MKNQLLFLCSAGFITTMNLQPEVKTISTINTVTDNTTNKTVIVGTSFLYGLFSAPSGSSYILLQNNNKNDLLITAQKESGKIISNNTFKFPTPLLDSSNFKISFKKTSAGQMPQKETNLRVGCDFSFQSEIIPTVL